MKNITKVGLSALAGALAVTSASSWRCQFLVA